MAKLCAIVIQVTNKVFIIFLPLEILLDTNSFSIPTSFLKKWDFYGGKIYFFQFQYPQTFYTFFFNFLYYPFYM